MVCVRLLESTILLWADANRAFIEKHKEGMQVVLAAARADDPDIKQWAVWIIAAMSQDGSLFLRNCIVSMSV